MYRWLRPLLFALPPEFAHALALNVLKLTASLPAQPPSGPPTEAFGLRFPNRVGVAAGLDKDAVAVPGLARLGFGFVEVGTVTPRPQAGNPKPRLFRLHDDRALVNRMGFNSTGVAAVAANLKRARPCVDVPIGVNIGKNRDTPLASAAEDYQQCLAAVFEVADYIVVNLSSPNTPGLRDLQAPTAARSLLEGLVALRDRLAAQSATKPPPLLAKVAPDLPPGDLEATASAALEAGAAGIVAVNTSTSRPESLRSRHAVEAGGLSGQPLFQGALAAVRRLRRCIGDTPGLIAVGGIGSGSDARAMIDAGADLVQVYTALVYEGPAFARTLAASAGAGRCHD